MLAHRVNKSEKDPCIACTRNVMCFISSHMITFDVSNVVILLVMLTGVEFIRWIRFFFYLLSFITFHYIRKWLKIKLIIFMYFCTLNALSTENMCIKIYLSILENRLWSMRELTLCYSARKKDKHRCVAKL